MNARRLYSNLATRTYSQISIGPAPSDAVFTIFETRAWQVPEAPPSDTKQGAWNVDHILELQVLCSAFTATSPVDGATSIPTDVWSSVSSAVNGENPESCTALASLITVEENLEGIPSVVNNLKNQVFKGRLLNKPDRPASTAYCTDFGKYGSYIHPYHFPTYFRGKSCPKGIRLGVAKIA